MAQRLRIPRFKLWYQNQNQGNKQKTGSNTHFYCLNEESVLLIDVWLCPDSRHQDLCWIPSSVWSVPLITSVPVIISPQCFWPLSNPGPTQQQNAHFIVKFSRSYFFCLKYFWMFHSKLRGKKRTLDLDLPGPSLHISPVFLCYFPPGSWPSRYRNFHLVPSPFLCGSWNSHILFRLSGPLLSFFAIPVFP